ncbi:hypothetical protein [Nocardia veterana]|uniref:Uncharacterized protein n=1 Tax=Nocardia veterana TaxID=132249 RepID=A0A7X6LVW7_9NOCA|nr:hypothetical protein [Nocardia veterana]NKY85575.1 hypothetical protein [Nocardia veterana]
MSYPYGSGYDGYPPPGYPPPGYPPAPYPGYLPYGYQEPRPSGGAAITAGIFALILALVAGVGVLGLLGGASSFDDPLDPYAYRSHDLATVFYVIAVVDGVLALLWATGGILLMNHKNSGRVLLVVLSSLGLLGGVAGIVLPLVNGVPAASIGGIVGALLAALMLSLTLSGSAKRWCGVGMHAYSPAAYYGQPPYPY